MRKRARFGNLAKAGYTLRMRNDRTNRLALLLVVFCSLGVLNGTISAASPTVLSVVVGGPTSHIAGELGTTNPKFGDPTTVVRFVAVSNPTHTHINLEQQDLPPPMG